MLTMLVEINVKEGKEEKFLTLFKHHQACTSAEKGNIRFDVLRDPEIKTRFYAYEVYASEEALNEHRKTPHYQHCVKELENLMTCPRSKKLFDWVSPEIS
ncbi:(4S)-4-hydroxy-5-phosphonooxypentane-2,3-dione isomerase [Avibacterium volantium]|uniref:(4S)-4-hydroxy-5-phosphonooxypentane-2,3-dione isomerase n=1 Tax=Avibacterium TaxID=292486 RepID=UPI0039FBEDBA